LNLAKLHRAWLTNADLTNARADGADLSEAHFRGAVLTHARLYNAELTGALNLTQGQLDVARGNLKTKIPANLRRPKSWETAEAQRH